MQQILYKESPYIVLAYSNDLEAYNTAKWQGYAASPAKVGNTLFPPYGNAGSENFLLIAPKTGETTQSGGSSLGLWVAVAVAVVVVASSCSGRAPAPAAGDGGVELEGGRAAGAARRPATPRTRPR